MTDPVPFPLPSENEAVKNFLKTRRSNSAKAMTGPGPSPNELTEMLEIAARVPDHRKLAPWRFILFQGQARSKYGQVIASVFKRENPDMPQDRVDFEANRFLRAPLVVGVVSSPKDCPRGTPKWEQELSSAVVCYNLCLAAQSMAFGANWLTEWYAFHPETRAALGLSDGERISGFIYIGQSTGQSLPRPRPKIEELVKNYS